MSGTDVIVSRRAPPKSTVRVTCKSTVRVRFSFPKTVFVYEKTYVFFQKNVIGNGENLAISALLKQVQGIQEKGRRGREGRPGSFPSNPATLLGVHPCTPVSKAAMPGLTVRT